MGNISIFNDMIEDKLLNIRTAYIGKVLSFNGTTATIQPVGVVKQYGKSASKQAIVSDVPVVQSARFKFSTEERTCRIGEVGTEQRTHVVLTPLAKGDLVFCVCADRDITEARRGNIATPPVGHHSITDSIVVGIL